MNKEKPLAENYQKALRQLAWAIENSQGNFKLMLAKCNYGSLRSRLIDRLEELCQIEISILQLKDCETKLFAAIHREFANNSPAALMVLGLDSVRELPQILANANQVRGDFRKHFSFPLILWINDDIYRQLIEYAPDLESWATSKSFPITKDELANYLIDTANKWFNNDLTLNKDVCLTLKSELEATQEYFQDDNSFDNSELEADLESLLGEVEKFGNQPQVAIEHYQTSLKFWRQVNNIERQAKILAEICVCYYLKVKFLKHIDNNHSAWLDTRNSIQEYLDLIHENPEKDLIKNYSPKIGKIFRDLQDWEAIKEIFNQSLTRHQAENKQLDLARDYGFLAEAALGEKNPQGAYNYVQQALIILSKYFFPDIITDSNLPENLPIVKYWMESVDELDPPQNTINRNDGSFYLFILAKCQDKLDSKVAAVMNLETARTLGDPREDLRLYLDILNKLHELYYREKKYLEAFEIKQEKLSVEQQFGLRAFVGAVRLESFKAVGLTKQYRYSEAIASEIAVSDTRKKDVDKLIERVIRPDYKLIVIYGQSGVGKSSLVNAGLEPALKNKSMDRKDNLTVVMRTYTNWEEELAKKIAEGLNEKKGVWKRNISSIKGINTQFLLNQLRELEQQNIRTILIFDQFEEFLLVCNEPAKRAKFFEFFAECLQILSLKVVLSLRIDYLHYLLECNKLSRMNIIGKDILRKDVLYEIGNFKTEDARKIIESLAHSANFSLETDLIDQLVEDLSGTLGEVRPIELQIIGAHLENKNIHTLEEYLNLGRSPKETLVQGYLKEVVENCGEENHQLAEILLYYLTDENETRPLKTRIDLERDLQEFSQTVSISSSSQYLDLQEFNTLSITKDNLNLILKILVESGLVLRWKQKYYDRYQDDHYQLVHDYIAKVIRQNKEPYSKVLKDKLNVAINQLQIKEKKLKKNIKLLKALFITSAFIMVLAIREAVDKDKHKRVAETKTIEAQITSTEAQIKSTEAFFTSGETRKASIIALQVAEKLKQGKGNTINNQILTTAALRQAVYSNYPITKLTTLSNDKKSIDSLAWSDNGKKLASKSQNGIINVWDATDGSLIKQNSESEDSWNWNYSSNTLDPKFKENSLTFWDITNKAIKPSDVRSKSINNFAWNFDGKTLASTSASEKGIIKIWVWDANASSYKRIRTFRGHSKPVTALAWSPISKDKENQILASASEDGNITLWDASGKLTQVSENISNNLNWNSDKISSIEKAVNGSFIVNLCNTPNGKLIEHIEPSITSNQPNCTIEPIKIPLKNNRSVNDIAWHPQQQTLAIASNEGSITINYANGQLIKTLNGHKGNVNGVAWNPNGKTLLSGGGDGLIKLWNTDTGKLIKTLHSGSKKIIGVAWTPDGTTLAFADEDNKIKNITKWSFNYEYLRKEVCNRLENYLVFHPEQLKDSKVCQTKSILLKAAKVLVTQSQKEAKNGNFEKALNKFNLAEEFKSKSDSAPE